MLYFCKSFSFAVRCRLMCLPRWIFYDHPSPKSSSPSSRVRKQLERARAASPPPPTRPRDGDSPQAFAAYRRAIRRDSLPSRQLPGRLPHRFRLDRSSSFARPTDGLLCPLRLDQVRATRVYRRDVHSLLQPPGALLLLQALPLLTPFVLRKSRPKQLPPSPPCTAPALFPSLHHPPRSSTTTASLACIARPSSSSFPSSTCVGGGCLGEHELTTCAGRLYADARSQEPRYQPPCYAARHPVPFRDPVPPL